MSASTEELSGMAQQLQALVAQFKVKERAGSGAMKALPTAPEEIQRKPSRVSPKKMAESEPLNREEEVTDITLKEDAA